MKKIKIFFTVSITTLAIVAGSIAFMACISVVIIITGCAQKMDRNNPYDPVNSNTNGTDSEGGTLPFTTCLYFDNDVSTNTANVSTSLTSIRGANNGLSAEAWVKCNGTLSDTNYTFFIFSKGHAYASRDGDFILCFYGEKTVNGWIATTMYHSGWYPSYMFEPIPGHTLPCSVTINKWYHVAYTYDSVAGGKVYLNGALLGGTFAATSLFTEDSTTAFNIGGSPYDTTHYWAGGIADVRLYNRALSAAEIDGRYKTNTYVSSGLTHQWKFDDASGTTAVNSINPTYKGILVGGSKVRWGIP